ncbi:MAG: hypothetical protein AAGA35_01565 [Patescibacteria group bacterium]
MKFFIAFLVVLFAGAVALVIFDSANQNKATLTASHVPAERPVSNTTNLKATAPQVDLATEESIERIIGRAKSYRAYGDNHSTYINVINRGEPLWDCDLYYLDIRSSGPIYLPQAKHKIGGCLDIYSDNEGTWYAVDSGRVGMSGDTRIYRLQNEEVLEIEGLESLKGLRLYHEAETNTWYGRSAQIIDPDAASEFFWHQITFPSLPGDKPQAITVEPEPSRPTPTPSRTIPFQLDTAAEPASEDTDSTPIAAPPEVIDFIDPEVISILLADEADHFTIDPTNPTMEQFPTIMVRRDDGDSYYHPAGTTWYRERFTGDDIIPPQEGGYTDVVQLINKTPAKLQYKNAELHAYYGERGWAGAYASFRVEGDTIQLLSYHSTLRMGSRFINSFENDGSFPLEPYYWDTWVFVSEPIAMDDVLANASDEWRDTSSDIPVPPAYHTGDDDFVINDSALNNLQIGDLDFSITNYGISGELPITATIVEGAATPYFLPTDTTPLLALEIPETAIPNTTYRGSTINLFAITDEDTIDAYCYFRNELQFAGRRQLGEREFGMFTHSEGAAGSTYDTYLFTSDPGHNQPCLVIDITSRSVNVGAVDNPDVSAFDQQSLDNIVFTFIESLYFES